MKIRNTIIAIIHLIVIGSLVAFKNTRVDKAYPTTYLLFSKDFNRSIEDLTRYSNQQKYQTDSLRSLIYDARLQLKRLDFWWRYFDPIQYKLIHGPLPVEWETEVFEKYEKPYKRLGAGLSLAELSLDENDTANTKNYIKCMALAAEHFNYDSVKSLMSKPDHFAYCNRLFLLNLAAIYTTGFECPNKERILPELLEMLQSVELIYKSYENDFYNHSIGSDYLNLYQDAISYVSSVKQYEEFNHFKWITQFVNPLYEKNAKFILKFGFSSKSMMDYSINKHATSIFQKDLYFGQNTKGVFLRVNDSNSLSEIAALGKLLFYDPILSGNNQRSCASCHIPEQGFTDTSQASAISFNHIGKLKRNAPSLVNAEFNHLIMQDGNHFTLQNQALAVITNPEEMGLDKNQILRKILSVNYYKKSLNALAKLTPQSRVPALEHILSALTYYYSKFNVSRSKFDLAAENTIQLESSAIRGFNLFMSKAQCATCHFIPHFNGVKPPYVGSEFEVLGTPDDREYKLFGSDSGRYLVNPAPETLWAFRTGTLKNISRTAPYMHNGVFRSLEEVMDFYNKGGGVGRGLNLSNQTLSGDSLNLSTSEINDIINFLKTLDEDYTVEPRPEKLPKAKLKTLNSREIGGTY